MPVSQGRAEAFGVFQIAAGIAAAVEIQDHALTAFVLGDHPGAVKLGKGMLLYHYLAAVPGTHQFADHILPLADGLQGAAFQQGPEQGELGADGFRGK